MLLLLFLPLYNNNNKYITKDDTQFYIVTDIYSGGDLFDYLEDIGILPEEHAAIVLNSLLVCMNYLHSCGMAHLDLKLENVLLDENKALDDLKVIDFGLCQFFTIDPEEDEEETTFSDLVGTPTYVSPQIIEGTYTYKADIWALGVVAYTLLCGFTPFDGPTEGHTMENVLVGALDFEDPAWEPVSDLAKEFVTQLLEYDEKDRPTAQKALQHPWLQQLRSGNFIKPLDATAINKNAKNNANKTTTRDALVGMANFSSSKSKIKQAVCALLSSQLVQKKEKNFINDDFRSIDQSLTGAIVKEDLHKSYTQAGFFVDEATIDSIFQEVNFSASGLISYSEFAIVMMLERNMIGDDKLQHAFDLLDVTDDGELTLDDLKQSLVLDDEAAKKMMRQLDDDGNGTISFDEFKNAILSKDEELIAQRLCIYNAGSADTTDTVETESESDEEDANDSSSDDDNDSNSSDDSSPDLVNETREDLPAAIEAEKGPVSETVQVNDKPDPVSVQESVESEIELDKKPEALPAASSEATPASFQAEAEKDAEAELTPTTPLEATTEATKVVEAEPAPATSLEGATEATPAETEEDEPVLAYSSAATPVETEKDEEPEIIPSDSEVTEEPTPVEIEKDEEPAAVTADTSAPEATAVGTEKDEMPEPVAADSAAAEKETTPVGTTTEEVDIHQPAPVGADSTTLKEDSSATSAGEVAAASTAAPVEAIADSEKDAPTASATAPAEAVAYIEKDAPTAQTVEATDIAIRFESDSKDAKEPESSVPESSLKDGDTPASRSISRTVAHPAPEIVASTGPESQSASVDTNGTTESVADKTTEATTSTASNQPAAEVQFHEIVPESPRSMRERLKSVQDSTRRLMEAARASQEREQRAIKAREQKRLARERELAAQNPTIVESELPKNEETLESSTGNLQPEHKPTKAKEEESALSPENKGRTVDANGESQLEAPKKAKRDKKTKLKKEKKDKKKSSDKNKSDGQEKSSKKSSKATDPESKDKTKSNHQKSSKKVKGAHAISEERSKALQLRLAQAGVKTPDFNWSAGPTASGTKTTKALKLRPVKARNKKGLFSSAKKPDFDWTSEPTKSEKRASAKSKKLGLSSSLHSSSRRQSSRKDLSTSAHNPKKLSDSSKRLSSSSHTPRIGSTPDLGSSSHGKKGVEQLHVPRRKTASVAMMTAAAASANGESSEPAFDWSAGKSSTSTPSSSRKAALSPPRRKTASAATLSKVSASISSADTSGGTSPSHAMEMIPKKSGGGKHSSKHDTISPKPTRRMTESDALDASEKSAGEKSPAAPRRKTVHIAGDKKDKSSKKKKVSIVTDMNTSQKSSSGKPSSKEGDMDTSQRSSTRRHSKKHDSEDMDTSQRSSTRKRSSKNDNTDMDSSERSSTRRHSRKHDSSNDIDSSQMSASGKHSSSRKSGMDASDRSSSRRNMDISDKTSSKRKSSKGMDSSDKSTGGKSEKSSSSSRRKTIAVGGTLDKIIDDQPAFDWSANMSFDNK